MVRWNRGMLGGACAAMVMVAAQGFSDEAATQAKAVMARWEKAVVTVELVVTMSMGESAEASEEMQSETIGVIVDPSGLVVVAHSAVDPAEAVNSMMGDSGPGGETMRFSSTVKDVKFRLHDGQEIPGEVALRDKDLNLAFLRPKPALTEKLPALNLADAASPDLVDEVVFLTRMGKVGNWVSGVSLERIQAKIEKPRLMYVPTDVPEMGAPCFDLKGKVIGLSLMKVAGGDMMGGFGPFSSPTSMGMLPVVLPADQVLEVAKQALQPQAEAKP